MRSLLWSVRLVVSAIVLGWLYVLTLWCGPDCEEAFFPVLSHQRIADAARSADGREACWTWHLDKDREARAVDANWTLRVGEKTFPYQAVRTVADSAEISGGLPRRPIGTGQFSRKCMVLPEGIGDAALRITGFTEYRTAVTGWLWSIRQPTAEASIP